MRSGVYRNLNKAKKNPSLFIWSIANVSATGNSPKLRRHTSPGETVALVSPTPMVKPKAMQRIATKAVREVGAWIVGEMTANVPRGTRRAFTLNPLPASRGGRSEAAFHYCRVVGGRLVIEEPVDFSRVRAAVFTDAGAYAVL